MDIKTINSNKEEIYIPMAGLDISEDNGIITVKSGFQHIGEYKTIGPINFKTIFGTKYIYNGQKKDDNFVTLFIWEKV